MKILELQKILFDWAPSSFAEDFDNIGLLIGDYNQEVSSVLITLDCTEEIINEAIHKKCNTIITFHPIIFSGLKKISEGNYVEKIVRKAIKNDINIIAFHTNLDSIPTGVNHEICSRLELIDTKVLIPKKNQLYKLTTYIPNEYFEKVKTDLFNCGAGNFENYKNCAYFFNGTGTFLPKENSNPFIGKINQQETTNEICLNIIFEKFKKNKIVEVLKKSHPYQEVAYEIVQLENNDLDLGMGRIGVYENPLSEQEFLKFIKEKLPTKIIKHSKLLNKEIKKVAVLGGSGSFAIQEAINQKADVFITADLKYHDFFKAENQIILMDIGHYESEQFTKKIIFDYLIKKNVNFAVHISELNTNPVNYF